MRRHSFQNLNDSRPKVEEPVPAVVLNRKKDDQPNREVPARRGRSDHDPGGSNRQSHARLVRGKEDNCAEQRDVLVNHVAGGEPEP